jgi:hypothetical protein
VGTASGAMVLAAFVVMVGLWLTCAVLGIHGLLLGRMPGRFLPRHVKRPRVWGAGALLVAIGGFTFPTLAVVGLGLVVIGHVTADA